MQDDSPYQAEGELRVTVHDVLRADVDQFDFLVAQKIEGHLHVLQHVKTHPTSLPRLKNGVRSIHVDNYIQSRTIIAT